MILFFKKGPSGSVNPVAVVDYTRSDDRYSRAQILSKALSVGNEITKSVVNGAALQVFSLSYQIHFRHSGVSLGNSLKTACEISIDNAPMELSTLINLDAITGQESVQSLQEAAKKILDPEVGFPYGAIVLRSGNNFTDVDIVRSFIVYSATPNYDSRRINNTFSVKGAAFDSMVIRLELAVDLNKDLPLVSQLNTALGKTGYAVTADRSIITDTPVVARYYPPGTLNTILDQVCKDNGVFYDMDYENKKITIKSLAKSDAPKSFFASKFCFRGQVPRAKIIGPFNVKDYATVVFEAEIEDVALFDVVTVYDDGGTQDQFSAFRKSGDVWQKGTKTIYGYDFPILQYEYIDSRIKTTVRITATNNWIVSNFKLDAFLENAVYRGVTL